MELQKNLCEDFTITEKTRTVFSRLKAPTRAGAQVGAFSVIFEIFANRFALLCTHLLPHPVRGVEQHHLLIADLWTQQQLVNCNF